MNLRVKAILSSEERPLSCFQRRRRPATGEGRLNAFPLEHRHPATPARDARQPSSIVLLQKNTYALTTTFLRHGASCGAVGSTHAEWNDQRETEPSVIES